jgi:hypothetical protein
MELQPPIQFGFLFWGQTDFIRVERDIIPKFFYQLKFFGGTELEDFLGDHFGS